jgi:hypothetical protein
MLGDGERSEMVAVSSDESGGVRLLVAMCG